MLLPMPTGGHHFKTLQAGFPSVDTCCCKNVAETPACQQSLLTFDNTCGEHETDAQVHLIIDLPAGSARRDDELISEVADTLAVFMEEAATRKALLSQPQVKYMPHI